MKLVNKPHLTINFWFQVCKLSSPPVHSKITNSLKEKCFLFTFFWTFGLRLLKISGWSIFSWKASGHSLRVTLSSGKSWTRFRIEELVIRFSKQPHGCRLNFILSWVSVDILSTPQYFYECTAKTIVLNPMVYSYFVWSIWP